MPNGDKNANAAMPPRMLMLTASAVMISMMTPLDWGRRAMAQAPPTPAPVAGRAETGAFAPLTLSASRQSAPKKSANEQSRAPQASGSFGSRRP